MSSPTGRQGVPVRTRLKLLRPPATYLWAVAAVAAGVALRTLLAPVLGAGFPFITFFPAIFVVAYLGGFRPTLFATILSALAVAYLFTHPAPILPLGDPAAQLGAALFAVSGIATGWLGESRFRAYLRAETAMEEVGEEAARAEQAALRAEEEAARAEEESARAEEETLHAEEQTARAEQESRKAARESERVERILSSIADAFVVLDREWIITYMNEPAAAIAGRKPSDYIGRNLWEAFPEMWEPPSSTRTAAPSPSSRWSGWRTTTPPSTGGFRSPSTLPRRG